MRIVIRKELGLCDETFCTRQETAPERRSILVFVTRKIGFDIWLSAMQDNCSKMALAHINIALQQQGEGGKESRGGGG